ncbi:uncharacterized protein CDV56_104747 [Aspergillus thermomutatus]|uniref:FAD/NAD(P)-binding domain-containing protein n=1 Tax=Aspergillus thermomutatus TaxID=41047 RepID=A0A397G5X6_ASPTH|nr:uncharacterized protein CDV56_104747 [Aspergillus thermomutatus]RHZ46422.1 hypothetical protein CDV56_104747 [Aspergillus thermomutatus]ULE36154.1 ThmC [Aspergillus thermomutatus]
MRVAVVGGGPSGLVVLKYLTTVHNFQPVDPIEAQLFEAEDSVGGTFTYRTYEDAELVSSTELTAFSDFRCNGGPDYLPALSYIKYLNDYCTRFNLWPHIKLSTCVTRVQRRQGGGHTVTFTSKDGETGLWECDAVAICSGLHVRPNIPDIDGLENVPVIFHSSKYKKREQLGNGNVLILGTGETAMDIAYFSVTSDKTKSTTISHRDGFVIATKRTPGVTLFGRGGSGLKDNGVPSDVSTPTLFALSCIHPRVRNSDYWNVIQKAVVKTVWWLMTGTTLGYNQWVGTLPDQDFGKFRFFYTKSSRAMPYISAPYRSRNMLQRIRSAIIESPVPDTAGKRIDLAPWPEYIDPKGVVHFRRTNRPESKMFENSSYKPDVVVLATGYTQQFPFIDDSYPLPDEADVRGIWKTGDETVGFIGFVRPSFGAIPPLAEMQSQLWVLSLINKIPKPLGPARNYLLENNPSCRIQYGVEHDAYAYQLACDVGGAASFLEALSRGWRVWVVWALGACPNTKFRLVGPWKWGGAEEVIKTELFATVKRRGNIFGRILELVVLFVMTVPATLLLYLTDGISVICEGVKSLST